MADHSRVDPRFLFAVTEAERKQEAYRLSRKAYGKAVGRPYPGDEDEPEDLRPPPGEIDNSD